MRLKAHWHCSGTINSIQFYPARNEVELFLAFPNGLLSGPSRRLAPVIKCTRFLSFFQRYIVRDISLT